MGEAVSQGRNCFNYQARMGATLNLARCSPEAQLEALSAAELLLVLVI